MDQKKVGRFLKTLRKEKSITQEVLAEALHVSGRTVSRWETGSNMPDISLLVELAEFYQVSIPEIIDGERKRDVMEQEAKDTAMKMAEYSKHELGAAKVRLIGVLLVVFGVFIMLSALAIFPNESSWGSIYSSLAGGILTLGVYFTLKPVLVKRTHRLLSVVACAVVLFGFFTLIDYVAVTGFHQVPRFAYAKSYSEDTVEHKTLFYTVIQENPGTENERVEIVS